MKHQQTSLLDEAKKHKKLDNIPRIYYRPDSHCSEFGSWYFSTRELGEIGPFDSRCEAKEALEVSLLMNPNTQPQLH